MNARQNRMMFSAVSMAGKKPAKTDRHAGDDCFFLQRSRSTEKKTICECLTSAMGLTLTLFQTQPCLSQLVQPRSVPYSSLGLPVQLSTSLLSFSCEKQVQSVEVSERFCIDSAVGNIPLRLISKVDVFKKTISITELITFSLPLLFLSFSIPVQLPLDFFWL